MYTIADNSIVVLFLEKQKPTADCIGNTSYHGDIQFSKRFPSNCLLLPSVTYGDFLVHEGATLWTAMASESIQKLSCSVLRPRTHRYHWKLVFWQSFKNWTLPNCPLELWWWQAYWPESKATCNKHLRLWSKDLKRSTQKFFPTSLNWFRRFRQWYCFLPSPFSAAEQQKTSQQRDNHGSCHHWCLGLSQLSPGAYQGIRVSAPRFVRCFSAASGAAPGGFFEEFEVV